MLRVCLFMSVSASHRPPHFREQAVATCQQNRHEALALWLAAFSLSVDYCVL